MLERVLGEELLAPDRPVVVMFSGGRDSTCLLDLAVRIAGTEAVTAVHANYGLRAAADADERHCADLCERLGVQLDVRRPVRPEGSGRPGRGPRRRRRGGTYELRSGRDDSLPTGLLA
jgi:tRNA(Ile)-lysidine synthase